MFYNTIPDNIKIKYPVVLVHGIACRDRTAKDAEKAWGRIPKTLRENNIPFYFGHSDAWGTIEENAHSLKETIDQIIKKRQCEKVNIIAHSKGGLDARYMISNLDMEDKVASLTTINTPHRGSELADFVLKTLPTKFYLWAASKLDASAKKHGDKFANCAKCGMNLSVKECQDFNNNTPNSDKVYYQSFSSYVSKLPNIKYWASYFITKIKSKDRNDGIVSQKSSQWGRIIPNEKFVNFNHDDIVDKGFISKKSNLILLLYLNLVIGLALKGF